MPFFKGSTPGFQIPLPHTKIYNDAHLQAVSTAIHCLTLKRSVILSCVLYQFSYLNILCGIVPITIDYLDLYIYIILIQMIRIHRNKKWNYCFSITLFFFCQLLRYKPLLWTTKPQSELFLPCDVVALYQK